MSKSEAFETSHLGICDASVKLALCFQSSGRSCFCQARMSCKGLQHRSDWTGHFITCDDGNLQQRPAAQVRVDCTPHCVQQWRLTANCHTGLNGLGTSLHITMETYNPGYNSAGHGTEQVTPCLALCCSTCTKNVASSRCCMPAHLLLLCLCLELQLP
jgi:hypothetical protein